ncbi:hypothetical protein [Leifsonia shinshuensis]|uniref:beta strand repeat-containing protein n=1 Tax=Leifsonia shinshuensis TaxID=150026 RepID=UPI002861900E|nr:hypothetical protein [Leifsonia shinshuensis]MDR6972019.1 putative repeat protein (TIGR01451 family) [Leifsonia shinshuensis]
MSIVADSSGRSAQPVRRAALRVAAFLGVLAAIVGLTMGLGAPAYADASITITPSSSTVKSGQAATFTVVVSCSTTGGCANTTVSFPTTTLTGDGPTNDFASWVGNSTCSGVTKTVGTGVVTFNYGTVPTGGMGCNFTVTPPEYFTYNNAQLTITPTVAYTGFAGAVAPTPAVLTVTAGRNVKATLAATPTTVPGGAFSFSVSLDCTAVRQQLSGDIGTSSVSFTVTLPTGFTETTLQQTPSGTPPGAILAYDVASRTVSYSDPTGATCADPKYGSTAGGGPGGTVPVININGTVTTDGSSPTPVGTTLCASLTGSVTYVDSTPGTLTAGPRCATVSSPVPADFVQKASYTTSLYNGGQYSVGGFGTPLTPYTYPGNWDGSGSTALFDILLRSNGANAGADFAVRDPMPCLSAGSGAVYSSLAPGAPYCQTPLYVPTAVTVAGFVPPTGTPLTLIHPDGSTATVAYAAGAGWTIPTDLPIAEIDVPPIASQGSNPAGGLTIEVRGYASAAAEALGPIVLTNTVTSQAFKVGDSTPLATDTGSASIIVENSGAQGRAILNPVVNATYNGATTCTETVAFNNTTASNNSVEITTAPSQQITVDYLAPEAAVVTAGATTPIKLVLAHSSGSNYGQVTTFSGARSYSAGTITAVMTPNFNGTGRTLYEWTIPAGVVLQPGDYEIQQNPLTVQLPGGCAGVYQNDITVGYGGAAALTACIDHSTKNLAAPSAGVPKNPTANSDLTSNGIGTSNYCGMSAPLAVAAINPAFAVDKQVQGNLDAAPVGSGGIGTVSPTGGAATYTVSFANTGAANLDNPVMYDLLPRVGDTEASSTKARQSQFRATLTSLGTLPAGVSVQYSTAANPCRPEVLASNPGCVNDWSSTVPSPVGATTALRFAYDGTVFVAGDAGTTRFSISYTVSTPNATVGSVAWNSVGTTVYSGATPLATAESSYTGLQATQTQPQIVKATSTPTYSAAGDTVSYTFQVTNNTAVTLSGVTVTDAIIDGAPGAAAPTVTCSSRSTPAATCSGTSTTLAPGQVGTFVATYKATAADLDFGHVTDRATVTAQPPTGGALTTVSNSVTVNAVPAPAMTLQKTASPTTVDTVGQTVTWSYKVANTGNTTLSGVTVVEGSFSGAGLSAVNCPTTTLAAGAATTCIATSTVTQADIDRGTITNTAAVTAATPAGQAVSSADSTAVVTATRAPALTVSKTASPATVTAAGQAVTFRFVVTNTGNTTLSSVQPVEQSFSGSNPLGSISCPSATLAPSVSMICTAAYTVSQLDVDHGAFENTANATATSPGNVNVSSLASTALVTANQSPALTLTKTSTPTYVTTAGQTVTYQFAVRNVGNVTVTGIDVEEQTFTGAGTVSGITCPVTTLAPAGSTVCTASYTVQQADIDRGTITNSASATGIDPSGGALPDVSSSAIVTVAQVPGLTIQKSATPAQVNAPGQVVQYSFEVGNNGNVTINGVTVKEVSFTGTGSTTGAGNLDQPTCPQTSVAPNATMTCTAAYAVTQADIDAGTIVNTAVATGTDPGGATTTSPTSTATVTVAQAPALALTKTADVASISAAGQSIHYNLHVTNAGNVVVTGIVVGDQAFTGSGLPGQIQCPRTDLAPGASMDCSAAYAVTQQDIDRGSITNTAVASGSAPSGALVTSDPSSASVMAVQSAALTVTKSADRATVDAAGQAITYRFLVTNTGNVSVAAVAAHELAFTGTGTVSAISCPSTTLAPDEETTCVATYRVTQADIDAGSITNTGDATATDPAGANVAATSARVTVSVDRTPGLALTKTADVASITAPGQAVTFRFHVANTGNVTVSGVDVVEGTFTGSGPLVPSGCTGTLAPGQVVDCSVSYTATQADLDRGRIDNTATASGLDPDGAAVTSAASTATVTIAQHPALTLVKQADRDSVSAAGQSIRYTYRITNDGNVTLANVAVVERAFTGTGRLSVDCPTGPLAPGGEATCAATYDVTSADVQSDAIVNTAVATGAVPLTLVLATSQPSTARVTVDADRPVGLASTGLDRVPALVGAAFLLVSGSALVLVRRLRRRLR